MNKNLYSLILTDEVVARIDQLAYQAGISRSQMIDHLLAREVGLATPEQKTRRMVSMAADQIRAQSPRLQIRVHTDQSSMELSTFVKYKYNPGLVYSFSVQRRDDTVCGLLRLTSRSSSVGLRQELDAFLNMLLAIDNRFARLFLPLEDSNGARFARTLLLTRLFEKGDDPETVSFYISETVALVDEALSAYFDHLFDPLQSEAVLAVYDRHQRILRHSR